MKILPHLRAAERVRVPAERNSAPANDPSVARNREAFCEELIRGLPAKRRATALSAWFALALMACSASGDAEERRLLESYGIDASAAEIMAVERLPGIREISVFDTLYAGDADLPLFRVRALLPGRQGAVLIANSGANEILAVDGSGNLTWRAGGRGEGPAEFRALGGLQSWRGDTVVALDQARNLASFWTTSGEFVRSLSADPVIAAASSDVVFSVPGAIIGVLEGGHLVVRGPEVGVRRGEPGLSRVATALTIIEQGTEPTTLAQLPGPWLFELRKPGRLPALLAPMAVGTGLAVDGDRIAWARNDAYEVVLLEPDARASHIWRVREPLEPVTRSVRNDYLRDWSPWFPVEEEIDFPAEVPSFDRMFVALNGDLWARHYRWDEGGEVWTRFDRRRGGVERFRFPARVRIMAATDGNAYGILTDEFDAEHLIRFERLLAYSRASI